MQGNQTFVLVASSKNRASVNIAQRLVERHGFESTGIVFAAGKPVYQKGSVMLAMIDGDLVDPPDLDSFFRPNAYVFLSTHRSESGIPAVTAHTTGNFGDARLGGTPRQLAVSDPDLLKNYMIALKKRETALQGYDITIEATHHGPTSLKRPVMFVELGSSEKEWRDEAAAGQVVDALMESLTTGRRVWDKVAVGFGGNHYSEKFNRFLFDSDMALACIAPKHVLAGIDSEMFGQMIQKSTKFPRYAALDWKGMGKEKDKILQLVEQFAMELVKL